MSFGYSVGGFLACLKLAKSVYNACKDGPKEYKAIIGEVKCMKYILNGLHDDARAPHSLINQKGSLRKSELLDIIKNCESTLKEVQTIINDRSSLRKETGGKVRRVWDAYHVGSADLDSLRGRLTFNTSVINAFLSSLKGASLTRIESKIDQIYAQLCQFQGNGDGSSIVSNASVETLDSVLSQIENHEDDAWSLIRRELQTEDIFSDQIEAHRESLIAHVKSLVRGGSTSSGDDHASKESLSPSGPRKGVPALRLVEIWRDCLPAYIFDTRNSSTFVDLSVTEFSFGNDVMTDPSHEILQFGKKILFLNLRSSYYKGPELAKLVLDLEIDIRSQKDASFFRQPSVLRFDEVASCVSQSSFSSETGQIFSTRCEATHSILTLRNFNWEIYLDIIDLPLDIILTLSIIAELPSGRILFKRHETCRIRLREELAILDESPSEN